MNPLHEDERKLLYASLKDNPEWLALKGFKTSMIKLTYYIQNGRCYFCQVPMLVDPPFERHPNRMTKEHLIPKSKNGKWTDNPVLSCYLCNHKKGDMTGEEFILSAKFVQILWRRYREGVYGK